MKKKEKKEKKLLPPPFWKRQEAPNTHLHEVHLPRQDLTYGAGYEETDPKWLEAYENKIAALRELWK